MRKEKIIKILHRLSDGRTYRSLCDMPVNEDSEAIGRVLGMVRKYQPKKMAG
nr:MAG TPA: hypothetical protein [Caudoviricetes sp.]